MIVKKVTITMKLKSVMVKNSGINRHVPTSNTNESSTVRILSFVNGWQSHIKFKNPVNVKVSVIKVLYSVLVSALKCSDPRKMTTYTFSSISSARGIDFFKT